MLMNKFKLLAFVLAGLTAAYATSCVNDLNTSPIDDSVVTSAQVYDTPDDFRQVLAKLYAGYAVTGQEGPAGQPDIQGIDEGFSSYIRQLWVHQVLSTDEAVVAWNDPGLPNFNVHSWGASNDFVMAMYSRIFYQIAMANEFIREAQERDEGLIQSYMAEARFLRAFSYWHALDLYGGNVPFITEDDPVGAYQPEPTNAEELFGYIESELLDILVDLGEPGAAEYGRIDRGAAWTLLSKLYLNAEVYIGQERWDDALTYSELLINSNAYSLDENYEYLFLADNNRSDEIIFSVPQDGENLQTFGGTTFIVHAAVGGDDMSASSFGIDGGWAGHRATPEFVSLFENVDSEYEGTQVNNTAGYPEIYVTGGFQSSSGYGNDWTPEDGPILISENEDDVYTGTIYFANPGDEFKFTPERNWEEDFGGSGGELEAGGANLVIGTAGLYSIRVDLNEMTYSVSPAEGRAMFHTEGQSLEIENWSDFNQGYAVTKWKNVNRDGSAAPRSDFVYTDFPMFRLADVYLMYAEATLRGASGGSTADAVAYVNEVRSRAYGSEAANISSDDLSLEFILDERGRELYWEAHRRTDLRRFEMFTGSDYIWSWKGGNADGSSTADTYEIFPIPSSDINSNLNLTQNPGY